MKLPEKPSKLPGGESNVLTEALEKLDSAANIDQIIAAFTGVPDDTFVTTAFDEVTTGEVSEITVANMVGFLEMLKDGFAVGEAYDAGSAAEQLPLPVIDKIIRFHHANITGAEEMANGLANEALNNGKDTPEMIESIHRLGSAV